MENLQNGFTTYDVESIKADWNKYPLVAIGAAEHNEDGEITRENYWMLHPEQHKKEIRGGETIVDIQAPRPQSEAQAVKDFLKWMEPFEQPVYGYNNDVFDKPYLLSALGHLQQKSHIPKHVIKVEKLRKQTLDLMPIVAQIIPENGSLPNRLDDACTMLGIPHDTYDDENDVYALFQEGRTEKLKRYLRNDVRMTGKLASRLRQKQVIQP